MDTRFAWVAADIQFSSDIIERKPGFDNRSGFARLDSTIVRSYRSTSSQLRDH